MEPRPRGYLLRRPLQRSRVQVNTGKKSSSATLGRAIAKSPFEDKCIGCLLGVACGDILGANLEFKSRAEIMSEHGRVEEFLHSSWRPLGRYTDDTEMTLALATSLIECQGIDAAHC